MSLSMQHTVPFKGLSPMVIANAIESQGMFLATEPFALNSYENRVFSFKDEDHVRWVAKFYRPGRWDHAQLLAEHAFLQYIRDTGRVAVGEPWTNAQGATLFDYEGYRFAIFRAVSGRAPERDLDDDLFALGEIIGQLHACTAVYSLPSRPVLQPVSLAETSQQTVMDSGLLSGRQKQRYTDISNHITQKIEQTVNIPKRCMIPLHGDCHPGNVLGSGQDGFALVDFDDCMTGPAIQDLWMFLSGNEKPARVQQLSELIEGYEMHYSFDRRQVAWIEALATVRMMRHCAWLVERWQDPAFPAAFPDIRQEAFWDQHIRALEHQLHVLDQRHEMP